MSKSFHVAIIGGGTGGLGLAHALRNAGVEVSVHERNRLRTERLQGYRVSLNPAGSRALYRCLPEHLWKSFLDLCAEPVAGDQLLTTVDLREILRIREQRVAVVADRADAVNEINRNTFQWLLSSDLDDVIHYGKVFQRYEHLDDGTVRCHFADGTSVTADFVVGADGGDSQVRRQLLPHARRVNTGLFIVAGKYVLNEETAKALPPALTAGMVGVMPLRGYSMASAPIRQSRHGGVNDETYDHNPALFDNTSDHILWSYNASARRYPHDVSELDADGLKRLVGGLIADWHPGLGALVAGSHPDSLSVLPIHTSEPVAPWPTTNVTVLGDAVHSMSPFLGLGAGTALRDADLLATRLAEADRGERPLLDAVADYERQMLDHGFAAVRRSLRVTDIAMSDSRFVRLVFKAAVAVLAAVPALQTKVFSR